MGRKKTLTNDPKARKAYRVRTKDLLLAQKDMEELSEKAPSYLKGEGKKVYERLVKLLTQDGLVKELDSTLIQTLAINIQILKNAYKDINKNGQTIITSKGDIKPNPSVNMINNMTKNIKALGADLGLSPQARASILALNDDSNENEQSIADILNEKGDF